MKMHLKLSDPHPSRMPSVTGNVNHFKHFLFAFASWLKERGRNVPLMVGGDGVGGWGRAGTCVSGHGTGVLGPEWAPDDSDSATHSHRRRTGSACWGESYPGFPCAVDK